MRFVSIPVCNLRRRPARSLLTALGIAVATAAFLALVGLSRGVERAWLHSLRERDTHLVVLRKGTLDILAGSIDEKVADDLRKVDGVAEAAGELADLVQLDTGDSAILTGWPTSCHLWDVIRLQEGRLPDAKDPMRVVLGHNIAAALGKKPYDLIKLNSQTFVVIGTARYTGPLAGMSIYMPLPTMQELLGCPGKVTGIHLRVDSPDDPERLSALRARLAEAFPDLVFLKAAEMAGHNRVLRVFRALAWSTSVVALAMALVVVLNTLLMSVLERTREIGVLSAVGWRAGRILAMIVLEGLALAAVGSLVGTGLGLATLHWLASASPLRGFVEPQISACLVAEVVGTALVLGVLGSLYPAWRAVRLNVVDALRYG